MRLGYRLIIAVVLLGYLKLKARLVKLEARHEPHAVTAALHEA